MAKWSDTDFEKKIAIKRGVERSWSVIKKQLDEDQLVDMTPEEMLSAACQDNRMVINGKLSAEDFGHFVAVADDPEFRREAVNWILLHS